VSAQHEQVTQERQAQAWHQLHSGSAFACSQQQLQLSGWDIIDPRIELQQ
jgi:hypothetical protein